MSEEDLIRSYHATIGPLYTYVSRRVGGDRSLAEDLVQDTWMRALASWPQRGVPDEPLAWLIRVARNTLISHFRSIRPESLDPASMIALEADPVDLDRPDAASLVGWGMARLRRAHADLLEAFYFDEKSVRQIATERFLSERAVEGRLRRARAKLKRTLSRLVRPVATAAHHAAKEGAEHAK